MDADFAAYIERVRAHRGELRDSVAAVDEALASPIARGGAWRERVRAALAELSHDFRDHIDLTERPGGIYDGVRLSHDFRDHIDLTERPGGIYDGVRHSAPRLISAVDRLTGEHVSYAEAIAGYLAVLEHGGTIADLPAFREEVTTLMGQLVRHRQMGADLVYEAFEVDLGGSG